MTTVASGQKGINLPRLLVISHVLPYPGKSGQERRLANMLKSLRERFSVTFLGIMPQNELAATQKALATLCDNVFLLPRRSTSTSGCTFTLKCQALLYVLITGLKESNYIIGKLELAPERLASVVDPAVYEAVLFEYWHAYHATSLFRDSGVPCLLDTHNILWQAYAGQLAQSRVPEFIKKFALHRYKKQEERAWRHFNALIAINRREYRYLRETLPENTKLFYAPMGIELEDWPYSWQPARPIRIGYYGGMNSRRNRSAALICYHKVMPAVWKHYPDAEFWIAGSNPTADIQKLAKNQKVTVTGYVPRIQEVLKTMSLVLCPWQGTYGFRSRIIEAMALGVPVIANPDAVYGMDLTDGDGIFLAEDLPRFTELTLKLLAAPPLLSKQSRAARSRIENLYDFKTTYARLSGEMLAWLSSSQRNRT